MSLLTFENVVYLLILLNLKTFPLAFHVRLYYYVIKNFYVLPRQKMKSIFEPSTMTTVTTMLEMDFNLHKSNSTYFTDMDISRTGLLTKMFHKFYRTFEDPALPKMKSYQFVYTPLGSVGVVFKREIAPYMPYQVESRIFGWTEKWLYVICVFKSGKTVYAYGLSKYVMKQQRKTISPETVIKYEGLLTPEAIQQNEKVQPYLTNNLNCEEVINLVIPDSKKE